MVSRLLLSTAYLPTCFRGRRHGNRGGQRRMKSVHVSFSHIEQICSWYCFDAALSTGLARCYRPRVQVLLGNTEARLRHLPPVVDCREGAFCRERRFKIFENAAHERLQGTGRMANPRRSWICSPLPRAGG